MAKSFKEYADRRKVEFTQDGADAYKVFSGALAVGSVIASARRQRVMTQRLLAELSGVQQADISRIERGLLSPNTTTFFRLIEALDFQVQIAPSENTSMSIGNLSSKKILASR